MKSRNEAVRGKGRHIGASRFASWCVRALALILAPAIMGCPADSSFPVQAFKHNDIIRTYRVYVPEDYDPQQRYALVVMLHGAGGTGLTTAEATEFNKLAEREGFIVAYPDGIARQWNDGRAYAISEQLLGIIDDVGFIVALAEHLQATYAIDAARTYAAGFSNGAMMAERLACEASDHFAAVAAVSGSLSVAYADAAPPGAPLPIMLIHGTDDSVIPYEGGYVIGSTFMGVVIPVEDAVRVWVARDACLASPTVTWDPFGDSDDGTRVWREEYHGALEDGEVIFYGIEGGGHIWPGTLEEDSQGRTLGDRLLIDSDGQTLATKSYDLIATEVIWDFFAAHGK